MVMNCTHCGSSIDYRFSTTCLNCNCDLALTATISAGLTAVVNKPIVKIRHHLVNISTILLATVAGLFVGAVATYFGGWLVYLILYKAHLIGSVSCGSGNALGWLLIFSGANVGSSCGGIFGFGHRPYKPAR